MKKFKNNKESSDTWCGQTIAADAYYEIQTAELFKWQNDSKVLTDIGSGDGIMNDGTNDITDVATAINFLKDTDPTPRDVDGAPLARGKVTQSGWHYQLHAFEFETSNLDSIYHKKVDNSDYGFCTMKFYKLVSGVETEITGDDLNQTYLGLNCIKTVVDWEPTHDYEIVGGLIKMQEIPTTDVRMWVVGVPDISEGSGGSKVFCSNVNLKFLGLEDGIKVDGRAPKRLDYNATYHTNKMRLIFRHSTGFQHKITMIFELFKA